MNVTIDAMTGSHGSQGFDLAPASPASRALWWFTLAVVVVGGLAMRLTTIDRGTPGIGAFVYFGLLGVIFLFIALPASAAIAFVWHTAQRFPPVSRRIGAIGDARVRWLAVALVIGATVAFTSAGRRLPPWHVWGSAALFAALLSWRVYALAVDLLRGSTLAPRNESVAAFRGTRVGETPFRRG
jgi:hypothetical protein